MVGAVVLAAGAATRFGAPKQRLLLPRCSSARRAASTRSSSSRARTSSTTAPCPAARTGSVGPGASLRCGLARARRGGRGGGRRARGRARPRPGAVDRVIDAWRAGAGDVVAASYGGKRGHPAPRPRGLGDVPDEGARARSRCSCRATTSACRATSTARRPARAAEGRPLAVGGRCGARRASRAASGHRARSPPRGCSAAADLEPVAPAAVGAAVEVPLGLGAPLRRQLAVEVGLHHLLALLADRRVPLTRPPPPPASA